MPDRMPKAKPGSEGIYPEREILIAEYAFSLALCAAAQKLTGSDSVFATATMRALEAHARSLPSEENEYILEIVGLALDRAKDDRGGVAAALDSVVAWVRERN